MESNFLNCVYPRIDGGGECQGKRARAGRRPGQSKHWRDAIIGAPPLIIQKKYGYSDREPAWQITENPCYQLFIGLPGYQDSPPFVPSLLVEFRKRLTDDVLCEINENLEGIIDSVCVNDYKPRMYRNRTHKAKNRIVSISQPYIRPRQGEDAG